MIIKTSLLSLYFMVIVDKQDIEEKNENKEMYVQWNTSK